MHDLFLLGQNNILSLFSQKIDVIEVDGHKHASPNAMIIQRGFSSDIICHLEQRGCYRTRPQKQLIRQTKANQGCGGSHMQKDLPGIGS